MKFDTFQDLIKFFLDKDLSKYEITECQIFNDQSKFNENDTNLLNETYYDVAFMMLHDSPSVTFKSGDHSILVVEDLNYISGCCSSAKIKLLNRELNVNICENENGLPISKFTVMINGQLYDNEFIITTDTSKHNTIKICK